MPFEPVNELEKALMRAAADPAYRPQFYKIFAESDIFFIDVRKLPEHEGPRIAEKDEHFQVPAFAKDRKLYVPIFSSKLRLEHYAADCYKRPVGCFSMNCLTLLKSFQNRDLWLNPGEDYGKEFIQAEIARILDGSLWKPLEECTLPSGTQLSICKPANYPQAFVDALIRFFKNTPEVKRAWLALFWFGDASEKAETMIGLELSGDWERITGSVGMIGRDVGVSTAVNCCRIEPAQNPGENFAQYFLNHTKPFYERKRFGLF